MTNQINGLSEHIEPILFVFCFFITSLIAIIGWFIKRTLGKLEDNVEDLWALARSTEKDLTILSAEHKVRHKGD